ncbi:MAG TPA: hypothetical protein VFD75_05105 [Pyrinomonadaceae bacterium]|nr:hypothetical protein [Pyrinomonadaceae bacterium]
MSTQVIEIKTNPTPTPTEPGVFDPKAAVTNAYDTLSWHNDDSEAHWPTPNAGDPTAWFQYQIPPGGTSDTLAPGPGNPPGTPYTLNYVCANHKDEKGSITVNPQP